MQGLCGQCFPVFIKTAGKLCCQVLRIGSAAAIATEVDMIALFQGSYHGRYHGFCSFQQGFILQYTGFNGYGFANDLSYFVLHNVNDIGLLLNCPGGHAMLRELVMFYGPSKPGQGFDHCIFAIAGTVKGHEATASGT